MNAPAPSRALLRAFTARPRSHVITYCERRQLLSWKPSQWLRAARKPSKQTTKDGREVVTMDDLKKAADEAVADQKPPALETGKLADRSVFDVSPEQLRKAETGPTFKVEKRREWGTFRRVNWKDQTLDATPQDPIPKARIRWQRKMVIRDVQSRHRINRAEKLLRLERSHLTKSPLIKGSIKKLGALARQIAGKPLNEAMIQMRFSKRRAAADVLKLLKLARAEAQTEKSMGSGEDVTNGLPLPAGQITTKKEGFEKVTLRDKDGKRRVVTDPTALYVDQAWVGRGTPDHEYDFRARGRINILTLPWTSVSVQLKEERTRIRERTEAGEKKRKKKAWVQLPDRPVSSQSQYTLW